MAEYFLETRLSECVRVGSGYSEDFDVEITQTANGQEQRRLVQPWPRRRFQIAYIENQEEFGTLIVDMYHKVRGKFVGFRFKAIDDFTTAQDGVSSPGMSDSDLEVLTATTWQMRKVYPSSGIVGVPDTVRTIFKPVTGTHVVGIYNPAVGDTVLSPASMTSAGVVSFNDEPKTILGLTQAAQCVVSVDSAGAYFVGQSVYFDGIGGMTEIENMRGVIVSKTALVVTVDINTTAMSAWTSGGTLRTLPQSEETVSGGCEFDYPVRFDTVLPVEYLTGTARSTSSIELVELINP